jgi:hypothetical protein
VPTDVVQETGLFAHCQDPLCRGSVDRPIKGLVTERSWLFKENDPNSIFPGVEKSSVYYSAADEKDARCKVCGGPCVISPEPTPKYKSQGPWSSDPGELLRHFASFNGGVTHGDAQRSAEVDALLERLAEVIAE